MTDTPLKKEHIRCVFCMSSSSQKTYSLTGKKCTEEQIYEKLLWMLGKDRTDALLACRIDNRGASICKACLNRLEKSYEFKIDCTGSVDSFLKGTAFKVKREIKVTPDPSPGKTDTAKVQVIKTPKGPAKKKVRRPLIEQQVSTSVENPKMQSSTAVTPEHSHHKTEGTKEKTVPEISESVQILRKAGIQGAAYTLSSPKSIDPKFAIAVQEAILDGDMDHLMMVLVRHSPIVAGIKRVLLRDLHGQCTLLASKTAPFCSILHRKRSIHSLVEAGDTLIQNIIAEMSQRVPFLLDVLITVSCGLLNTPGEGQIGPLAFVYATLMHQRNHMLSALHRMTTLTVVEGHLDDQALRRLNKLGITEAATSKLRLEDEAVARSQLNIVEDLQQKKLCKITGDNLDIYIRTGQQSVDSGHKDLHFFASNIIFPRCATIALSNKRPSVDPTKLSVEKFILHGAHKERLWATYKVIIGRILVSHLPALSWMRRHLPAHISHEFSSQMSQQTRVHPLPIQFRNEAKHEDCVCIMDSYEEQLQELYTKAFGNADLLHTYKTVLGGDQLTRVRFSEVKSLRSLATSAILRFQDLHPIVCEMWHNKQDFLEKAYKALYKKDSAREAGTLFFFKSRLKRTDVNGKVKGHFQAHADLILTVGQMLIVEQGMEFLGMSSKESSPTKILAENVRNASLDDQLSAMSMMLDQFLKHYRYLEFSLEDVSEASPPAAKHTEQIVYKIVGRTPSGYLLIKPEVVTSAPIQTVQPLPEEDKLYNYCLNLCQWCLQFMSMNDTATEGDLSRVVPNCLWNLPFFFSHSKLSKYFIENLDYILKADVLASPLERIRILEGSFVNYRGGVGNNIEADLVQEHSVRNAKSLIRQLGANKTEKAILRAAGAADAIDSMVKQLDKSLNLEPLSSKHAKKSSEKDEKIVHDILREVRPFQNIPSRTCEGFSDIGISPFTNINKKDMREHINRTVQRLVRGQSVICEEEDGDN